MEEACLCCEGKSRLALKQPLLMGCVAQGQYCCCKIAQAFPYNTDLEVGDTKLNLPSKAGAAGTFFPKPAAGTSDSAGGDSGGGAVASEGMSR